MTQIIQLVDSRINMGERLLESSKFILDVVMRGVILIVMQLVYCVIVFNLHKRNCLFTSFFFPSFFFLPKQTHIPKQTLNFSLHFCQCYACLLSSLYLLVWSMCMHTYIFQCYMYACLLKKFCIFLMVRMLRLSDLDGTHLNLGWSLTWSSFLLTLIWLTVLADWV